MKTDTSKAFEKQQVKPRKYSTFKTSHLKWNLKKKPQSYNLFYFVFKIIPLGFKAFLKGT